MMQASTVSRSSRVFDPVAIKADFPVLSQSVHGRPVCYLDSANSAQKPEAVIRAMDTVLRSHYANVHRAVYAFGAETSAAYEKARGKVARFLNARQASEIVFTRNATEAINLVAATFGAGLGPGDEIILSALEHHANIVPWYLLQQRTGVTLKVVPLSSSGELDMAAYRSLLSEKTRLVSLTHMSNALGTVTPAAEIVSAAHAVGARVLLDGAQAAAHVDVDVQALGVDFYVLTGHKLYGPTGIGALYGRAEILAELPPFLGGGEMIESVSFDEVTFKTPPYRFEAGTPPIVEAIGLGAAIDYLSAQDLQAIHAHEKALAAAAAEKLSVLPGLRVMPAGENHTAIVSFVIEGVHPHDIATVFDQMGVAVRAGHHCAQPLMAALGVTATVRASFALYNTVEDVERLAAAAAKARELFS